MAEQAHAASARLRLSSSYVLILEWLEPYDRLTGTNLYTKLTARNLAARLVTCHRAQDVRDALRVALDEIKNDGVPIVHIESHGDDPTIPLRKRAFGARNEEISWADLGAALSPLNRASDFNVLLVGAACWGISASASFRLHDYAPFVGCIGFATSVGDRSLEDAVAELYRRLLIDREEIGTAVNGAQRELHSPSEKLAFTTSARLATLSARGAYEECMRAGSFDDIQHIIARLSALSEEHSRALAIDDWEAYRLQLAQQHVQKVWNEWFPFEVQRRSPSYQLDWQSFISNTP
jgi:hypothetical protein